MIENLPVENVNIVVSLGTLIALIIFIAKISANVQEFKNRVDNIEDKHLATDKRMTRMEARHESNESKINDIHIGMARMEQKLDSYLWKE